MEICHFFELFVITLLFYLPIIQFSSLASVARSKSLFLSSIQAGISEGKGLFSVEITSAQVGWVFKYFDSGFFNLNRLVYVLTSAEGIIQEESLCPNCMCFLSRQPGIGIFPNTQGSSGANEKPRPQSATYLHQLVRLHFISLEALIVLC